MQAEDRAALAALITGQRQAALGTLADGAPFVSMVLYALERASSGPTNLLIHVSRLSPHTGQLLADPRASLLIAQPDTGEGDPQALPRVTVQARASALRPEDSGYEQARASYIARLPQSAFLFSFPDFTLFRLVPSEARYIGGFAKAFALSAAQFQQALE
jgi:heme iron utilization protein